MRILISWAPFVSPLIVAVVVGCGGADDPLGGPYGGVGSLVAPNAGNVDSTGDLQADASADAAGSSTVSNSGNGSSSGPGSSGHSSGSGSSSGVSTGSSTGSSSGSGSTGSGRSSGSASGSNVGSGGVDAGTPGTPPPPAAPTWSHIFSTYLANGTPGGCTRCHGQMSSASASYSWLKGQRYISGTNSLLVSQSGSCLSWYGGNMPPGGPRNSTAAVAEMSAWASAGALNN